MFITPSPLQTTYVKDLNLSDEIVTAAQLEKFIGYALSSAISNILKITPIPIEGKSVAIAKIEIGDQTIELSAPAGYEEDGSEENPFRIGSAEGLLQLQKDIASGLDTAGVHYKQITDIDLSGIAWTGLGGQEGENPFKGIYDGNNKSIYNVNFSCADKNSKYRALFASTSNATIKNLTIEVGNKHVASDGTITYTGNGFADDMVEGCTFGGAPLAGYFGSGSKAINVTTKGVLGAEGEYGKDVPNHNIAGLVVLAVSDNDKGSVEFENCRSEVKLIAGYTKAGGLVTYEYDYGYPQVTFTDCVFAGSLKVVDTPKTIPSPGTTGWGGLVGWTTGGAGAVGGKTIFNNCRQLGTVEKENLDLSKETTFGQFIGYANGNTILSGDNYMNTDNVGFKWSDSVGSEGRGKTGYGDLATIIDKQIAVPAVRICLEGEDVKSLDNPKVACHSLTTKESIVTLKAGEELTIDCAIGDAYVVDSSGNKIDGVSAGGTSKKYVGK